MEVPMTRYERIVFLQGDEATEAMAMLDEHGEDRLMDHLAQWDCGDRGDVHEEPASGSSDDVHESNGFRLTYNARLGYCGLERII
jgi:hypothetical protein